jgi:hypothetical protein
MAACHAYVRVVARLLQTNREHVMNFFKNFFLLDDIDGLIEEEKVRQAADDRKSQELRRNAWNLAGNNKGVREYTRITQGSPKDALGGPPQRKR